MKGLIYKDFVLLRKQLSTYLVFLIVYGGFCIAGVFPISILVALVAVIGLTVPLSSVATDDATRWDRYAVSTPVSRRGVGGGEARVGGGMGLLRRVVSLARGGGVRAGGG